MINETNIINCHDLWKLKLRISLAQQRTLSVIIHISSSSRSSRNLGDTGSQADRHRVSEITDCRNDLPIQLPLHKHTIYGHFLNLTAIFIVASTGLITSSCVSQVR